MGFSSTNYHAATNSIPVVTQNNVEESYNAAQQSDAQKKGLLSTILSDHRRKDARTTEDTANTTLG